MPLDMGPSWKQTPPPPASTAGEGDWAQHLPGPQEVSGDDWTRVAKPNQPPRIDAVTHQRNASLEQLVQQYALLNIGQERSPSENPYQRNLTEAMAQGSLLQRATIAERGISQSQVDTMRARIQQTPVSFGARPAPEPYRMYPPQLPPKPTAPPSRAARVLGALKSLFS